MRFPVGCLVWSVAAIIVAAGLLAVVVYGRTFGYVKSLLWLVAFLISFGVSVLCVEPIKALFTAVVLALCLRRPVLHADAKGDSASLPLIDKWLQYRQVYASYIRDRRLKSTSRISRSTAVDSLAQRRRRERYLLYYHQLTVDLVLFTMYLITLLLIVLGTRDSGSYYSNRLATDYLIRGRYVHGPHRPLLNETDLWRYLHDVLVPTIHPDHYQPELRNTGWLRGQTTKLIGVARLRQHRVRSFCDIRAQSRPPSAWLDVNCAGHFDVDRRETRNFSLGWQKYRQRSYGAKFARLTEPWQYRNAWQSQSMHVYGAETLYPGGGYILPLGRTLANSRAMLRYARRTGWLDRNTTVVFAELTLYTAQVNLFNVIAVCIERTPLGNYRITPTVQTVRLLLILENLTVGHILLGIAFVVSTLAFAVRLLLALFAQRRHLRTFCRGWVVVDTLVVLLSVGAVLLYNRRDAYVTQLLDQLEQTRQNTFVSFANAAFGDRLLTGWCSVLIALTTLRLWKVLQFMRVFRVIRRTFASAAVSLLCTSLFTAVIVIALAMAGRLLNGTHSSRFGTMSRAVTTLAVLSFGFVDEHIGAADLMHGGRVAGGVLLLVLTLAVNVYLLNVFVSIVCQHFAATRLRDARRLSGGLRGEAPFSYWTWVACAVRKRCGRKRCELIGEEEQMVGAVVRGAEERLELVRLQMHLFGEVMASGKFGGMNIVVEKRGANID